MYTILIVLNQFVNRKSYSKTHKFFLLILAMSYFMYTNELNSKKHRHALVSVLIPSY